MANSAGEIEGFLEEHYGESLPVECSCLRRSLACLQRGMRWCKNRQAYLDLVAGDYVSNCEATCLRTFKEAVTAGRQLSVACADECVMLDTRLCDLILDNALSNAFQHGDLENPNVHLAITVTDAGLDASPGKKTVSFRVTNRARPGRPPLTEAFVAELLRGGRPTRRTNPMSDGIGFRHLMMAGRAHGMELSLWQELDLVTFEAQVAVDAADRTAVAGSHIVSEELVRQFPSGLNIYYIDDSLLAQQLVEHNLRRCAQPNCVKTFGKEPADARPFVSAVLEDAHIAILDQNLDWPGECLQGTTLVQELLEADFKGLICIRSANTSEQDTKKYRRSGAHCVLGKELSMALAINMMKAEYVRHGRRARLASSPLVEWDLSLPGSSSTPLTADQSVFEPYSQTSEPSQAGASSRDRAGSCEA